MSHVCNILRYPVKFALVFILEEVRGRQLLSNRLLGVRGALSDTKFTRPHPAPLAVTRTLNKLARARHAQGDSFSVDQTREKERNLFKKVNMLRACS